MRASCAISTRAHRPGASSAFNPAHRPLLGRPSWRSILERATRERCAPFIPRRTARHLSGRCARFIPDAQPAHSGGRCARFRAERTAEIHCLLVIRHPEPNRSGGLQFQCPSESRAGQQKNFPPAAPLSRRFRRGALSALRLRYSWPFSTKPSGDFRRYTGGRLE
jgi:hypothetical protein